MIQIDAETNKWGVPDWRDASEYELADDLSLCEWRWQFTRRRADYRQDFEKALMDINRPRPARDLGIDDDTELKAARSMPFPHPLAKKYGLENMYDPIISDWSGLGIEDEVEWSSGLLSCDKAKAAQDPGRGYERKYAAHYVPLIFDLSRPLEAQLEDAQHHLAIKANLYYYNEETGQTELPRSHRLHRSKFPVYIRLLDAKSAGATLSQISTEILAGGPTRDDQRTAGNMLQQAIDQMHRF